MNPQVVDAVREAVPEVDALPALGGLLPPAWSASPAVGEFGVRMLHSCLVDADYLDTAAHFAGTTPTVCTPTDMTALFDRLIEAREAMFASRSAAPVDRYRREVFDACLTRAGDAPGVFRLSAPTGSGKTISAAAFALRHAALHGKRRVVVAVPFTTVTEQNAAIYRTLLGDAAVLEHHSAVEPEHLPGRGVENWDAPFIVTTTVQLFESLFSNKPSKTRKLHRLAGSVIVLDEVQAIPDRLLAPILDGLKVLVEHFGVTVLMASATQPTWEALKPWRDAGLVPKEVVPDRLGLFQALRRVTYDWLESVTLQQVADLALSGPASLSVVNTTANARSLVTMLMETAEPTQVVHLSTRMCRAHRAEVLTRVRRDLTERRRIYLVSTQLIEAGVDVDFPLVLRQVAPAPSLIQSAGRANREGRNDRGRVVIFDCPGLSSLQAYESLLGPTRATFRQQPDRLDDPDAVADYYRSVYQLTNVDDQARLIQQLRSQLSFRQIAEQFRLIEDDSTAVVVDWRGQVHARLLAALGAQARAGRDVIPMGLLRELQPFVVNLPARLVAQPEMAALVSEPVPGLRLWCGPYDALTGIGDNHAATFVF